MWAGFALLLCAFGLRAPAVVADVNSATRLIELSPYYLPELADVVTSFPEDGYGGRSFRMFGIDDSGEDTLKGLNRAQAKQQCVSVGGLGLAGVFNDARKEALDKVVAAAANTFPQVTAEQIQWVGGFRTTLSEPNCRSGPVQHYPYFNDLDPASWNGCGTDPIEDWGWTRPAEGGGTKYVMWSDLESEYNLRPYWDSEERTGIIEQGGGNPSAFSDYNFNETKGYYENCTVAIVYADDNQDVFEEARNKAFWKDWGCRAPLYRWVCEMPDEEGLGIGGDATVASVASAGYFVEGMSNEYRKAQDGMQVRLFGILPEYSEGALGEALTALKWYQATHTCLALGAQGLAIDSTPIDHSARSTLLTATYKSMFQLYDITSFKAWLGGFTSYLPGPDVPPLTTTDFTWWTDFEEGFTFAAGPRLPTHERWISADYPSSNLTLFGDPDNSGEAGDERMTSCIYVTADNTGTEALWRNIACNSYDIQFFMCQFPPDYVDTVFGANASLTAQDFMPPSNDALIQEIDVSGDDDDKTAIIVGVVVALVVLLLAIALGVLFFLRRKRAAAAAAKQREAEQKAGSKASGSLARLLAPSSSSGNTTASTTGSTGVSGRFVLTTQHAPEVYLETSRSAGSDILQALAIKQGVSAGVRTPSHNSDTSMSHLHDNVRTTLGTISEGQNDASAPQMPVHELQERLRVFAAEGKTFANRYVLLPDQRAGGQGVVQFATGLYNNYEYALKFFSRPEAFEAECVLYRHPTLQQLLPKAEDMFSRGNLVPDGNGSYWPPCIVMEKGEALDEWSQRAKPDVVTSVQVLIHLSARLDTLHKAKLVHRDLKPSNVMWLPRENKWTIIDYGCAAAVGSRANAMFSLAYVAPEVIKALHAGDRAPLVDSALDCWSVGVMAYELLTGERGYDASIASEEYIKVLCDESKPLPWEGENLTKEKARKLGFLRKPVLQLLSRNPAERPSMEAFKQWVESIFAGTTVTNM